MPEQLALITGASSGIGASLALFLAEKGFRVALTARREERLREIERTIHSLGGNCSLHPADLGIAAERERLLKEVSEQYGTVHVLVNNAGFGWYGYYTDMPWDLARQMVDINILAVMHLTTLFLPGMVSHGHGHIINISSIAGGLPNQGIGVYSGSKAFVDAFSTALYREYYGSGVSVSAMRLGPVETEFYDQARSQENGGSIPAERFAISTDRVNRALWRLLRHPRRAVYVPGWLSVSKHVENIFGNVIDLLGPLLLKKNKK